MSRISLGGNFSQLIAEGYLHTGFYPPFSIYSGANKVWATFDDYLTSSECYVTESYDCQNITDEDAYLKKDRVGRTRNNVGKVYKR